MAGGHGPQSKVTAILLLNKCDVPVKLTSKHLFLSAHTVLLLSDSTVERDFLLQWGVKRGDS